MRRDDLGDVARRHLAFAAAQLQAAGISIDEEAILSAARPTIVVEPRLPYVDKLQALIDELTSAPAPRNRHERRKAAALSRRGVR